MASHLSRSRLLVSAYRQINTARSAGRAGGVPAAGTGQAGSIQCARRTFATSTVDETLNKAQAAGKTAAKSSNLWTFAAAGAGLGAAAYLFTRFSSGSSTPPTRNAPTDAKANAQPAAASPPAATVPAFSVTDQYAKPLALDKILGDFSLLTFAPTANEHEAVRALKRLADVIVQVDRKSNMQFTQAIFLATDEVKDADEFRGLVEKFYKDSPTMPHKRWFGVHGPEVQKLRDVMDVYAGRAAEEGTGYPSSHDMTLFLLNPRGEAVATFEPSLRPEDVGNTVAQFLGEYKHRNPSWHAPKAIKERHA